MRNLIIILIVVLTTSTVNAESTKTRNHSIVLANQLLEIETVYPESISLAAEEILEDNTASVESKVLAKHYLKKFNYNYGRLRNCAKTILNR